MNHIKIRELTLQCLIGVHPEERATKQTVIIDVDLLCDLSPSEQTDQIGDTLDYTRLNNRIIELVEHSDCQLLEMLVDRIADTCLEEPRVKSAKVCVQKPGALRFAHSVAVEVEKARD